MLVQVLFGMGAQRPAGFGMRGVEMQRVEFVIAHDRTSLAAVDQVPHQMDDGAILWPAIDEVAQKDDAARRIGMVPAGGAATPAKPVKRRPQLGDLPVNIRDDIGGSHSHSCREFVVKHKSLNAASHGTRRLKP